VSSQPRRNGRRGESHDDNLRRIRASLTALRARSGAGDDDGAPPEPDLVCMADVQPRAVDWLFRPWLPRGEMTLLDGDPGMAKSTLSLDLIARVTRGWPMPPAAVRSDSGAIREPGRVVILSAEDDPHAVIRPRLDAAGADCSRVFFFPRVKQAGGARLPVLPDDLELLADYLAERRPALVVIDPLMAYLAACYDAHKDSDIRHCLHRTVEAVRTLGAALLVIRHLNKLIQGSALYRGGGSVGIIGAARVGWLAGRHPDEPEVRVLAQLKNNLAPVPLALTYRLGPVGEVARVDWGEESDLAPDEILTHPSAGERGRPAERLAAAEVFLREVLADGPVGSDELERLAARRGVRKRTLEAARQSLGVRALRIGSEWLCALPPDEAGAELEIPE
jgi:AAA domain